MPDDAMGKWTEGLVRAIYDRNDLVLTSVDEAVRTYLAAHPPPRSGSEATAHASAASTPPPQQPQGGDARARELLALYPWDGVSDDYPNAAPIIVDANTLRQTLTYLRQQAGEEVKHGG